MDAVETAALRGYGSGLLERSIGFAVGVLESVTAETLRRPTPCRGWDLEALLRHMAESLAALCEAVDTGSVRLFPDDDPGHDDLGPAEAGASAAALVVGFRAGADRLLGAWTAAAEDDRSVTVGGCPMRGSLVAGTGAIEIAVHGWDVAWATGRPRPIPPALAGQLLRLASTVVTDATRHGLFAPPVPVPPAAGPNDRLLAYLGRDPSAVPG
ncbi:TIGR03086 family metal-binding protein [Actinomadura rubrisoli]|uniref:TIGR03086 family protein n=1 Tax=Actinomadura rubrisoli TaxID=2530368 RepID=A0A4R5CCQ1_9ACTN|nr:TIGR03086 family metal-binding protein [Actinomadura rubrisoli]TDD96060.1 TIGR03086 family protein [Actinomadura rubrisoli]